MNIFKCGFFVFFLKYLWSAGSLGVGNVTFEANSLRERMQSSKGKESWYNLLVAIILPDEVTGPGGTNMEIGTQDFIT